MLYYYTSSNVKILRNIIKDYKTTSEISPYEFMESYVENSPETSETAKVSWIAETFLGYHKHQTFLMEITAHLSEQISEIDQDYFMILFHAVIFKVRPEHKTSLYKCFFNLSKSLLDTFTKFLSNNEILPFISQVAHNSYDTNYITDKIIGPLFEWQPYFSEMSHNYTAYIKRMEARKLKPPTIPVQLNVLNRKNKKSTPPPLLPHDSLPRTPINSLHNKKKRMLTKSAIDEKLKLIHEKNKQKAENLLNNVKNKDFHYARVKSDTYDMKHATVNYEAEYELDRPYRKSKQDYTLKNPPPIKHTTITLQRLNKIIQQEEEEEIKWFENIIKENKDTLKIEEIEKHDRLEKERERLLDIEKKHLMGQITHEEAVLAKQKLHEDNKKKYEDFLKEKELWNEHIENWKKDEMDKNRRQVEKLSLDELKLLEVRNDLCIKKKESAEKVKEESKLIAMTVLKVKQEELDRKINVIKEIRILAMIAQKAKVPKIIDLTETAGFGFLCEMSIAELQERLSAMKMELKDDVERKKKLINDQNKATKEQLQETKASIDSYLNERAILRKTNNKKSQVVLKSESLQEIADLKQILNEKRKLRMAKAAQSNR